MNRSAVHVSLILAVAIALTGCAARRTPYDELYKSLKEEWRSTDYSVLENRRIVIDPGHGGAFGGAMGPDSLREADANLGVALYLWGLLEEAGADAHLTRTTDRDFLPEGSEELKADLEHRVAEANAYEPEVFISIHHNSNLALDRARNGVEVFYRGNDPEASLELANDIYIHLARNLGIEQTEIQPGNYFVLRNSAAQAAVLGEASYISHPVVEERLKLSNKQKLEAEAYFLGLVSYFSKGVPSLEPQRPRSDTLSSPGEISFAVAPGGGVPIDPATARIVIGDCEEIAFYDPLAGTLSYALEPNRPNGILTVRAKIRSAGGATATSRTRNLLLSRPAAHILPLPASRKTGETVSLGLKVLDALGQPVADGTPVRAQSLETKETFDGRCKDGVFNLNINKKSIGAFAVETAGKHDTIYVNIPEDPATDPIRILNNLNKRGIPFPIAIVPGSATIRGDAHGWLHLGRECRDRPIIITAAGYRPLVFMSESDAVPPGETTLEPLFGSLFHGRRIVIDPAGGGADDGGTGNNELRGATVNLEVARRLRDICTACGADVVLARNGEETLSSAARIHRTNRSAPDLAISIHHGGDDAGIHSCTILHYPGSEQGRLLAGRLAEALSGLPPCGEYAIEESARAFLTHTNCPACEIHFNAIEDESAEAAFSNPRYAGFAAEHMFAAIARYLAAEDWECNELALTVLSNGLPLREAAVGIDQTFSLFTGENGTVSFGCLDSGAHIITVTADDGLTYVFVRDFKSPPPAELILDIDKSTFSASW